MAKNNSVNLDVTVNATGYTIGGGSTTERKLTVAGTGDFTITNPNAGPSTFTTPNQTADILVGASAFTAAGTLIYGSGAGTYPSTLGAGTSGQVLTSNGTSVGWSGAPFVPTPLVSQGSSITMTGNTRYQTTGGSPITLTLPATASAGTQISITANGAGGFIIAQAAGQTIHFGTSNTTTGTGGSLASTAQYDTVSIYCSTANTDWTATSAIGNITVV